jgi:hypothetical protein
MFSQSVRLIAPAQSAGGRTALLTSRFDRSQQTDRLLAGKGALYDFRFGRMKQIHGLFVGQ